MRSSLRARLFTLPLALAGALSPFGCSGSGSGAGADAGADVDTISAVQDAGRYEAAPPVDAKTPWARMQPHDKHVLASMRLQVVYLGYAGDDGSPSFDDFIDWLLASDYWAIMKQYGVGPGSRIGSMRVPRTAVIPDAMVKNGLITSDDLDALVASVIHTGAPPPPDDAGTAVDAAATDAGADAASDAAASPSDASPPPGVAIPEAQAYLFFLPDRVNVSLGSRGGHVFQTCVDAGGYHAYDGSEPYAVIPPCAFGRSPLAVSHELAEMVTDPVPGTGWFSDKDVDNSGGEIGDLCNQAANAGADGWQVTQLWSNADGDCEPN